MARGMSKEAAWFAASQEFGHVGTLQNHGREARGGLRIESVFADVVPGSFDEHPCSPTFDELSPELEGIKINLPATVHLSRSGSELAAGATVRYVDSSLERLRVSYALAGDYDDIRSLIYDIETAPDFLVIENVFLSEGQDEQAPLTLTLEVSTYFRTARRAP